MQLEIRGRGTHVTDELGTYVQRRVSFALGRLARQIKRVSVLVEDTNGPKGGIDKRCCVAVVVPYSRIAVIEARSSSIHVAINRAFAKAGRWVTDRLKQPHWTKLSIRKGPGPSAHIG